MWTQFTLAMEEFSAFSITMRLLFSLITGVLIGLDRGLKKKSAGIKTHSLVCMGSALVMITSEYMQLYFESNVDLSRMGAQVISGVGFLGVGTIIVTGRNQIKGLTTAAGLWVCACVGLAIGIGFIEGAVIAVAFIMITLVVLSKLDHYLHYYVKEFDIYIEFESNKSVALFVQRVQEHHVKITQLDLSKGKLKGSGPNAVITLSMDKGQSRLETLNNLRTYDFVQYIEEI